MREAKSFESVSFGARFNGSLSVSVSYLVGKEKRKENFRILPGGTFTTDRGAGMKVKSDLR
jgi:hypothetical protein